jgi:DNA mismatch repair protein MSH2
VSKSKNFTIIETNKGGVKFRNSLLSRLNEEQMDVKRKYEEVQRSVVKEIMDVSSGYSEPMLHLGRCVSRLDCLVSLATAAVSAPTPFCRPTVLPASAPRALAFTQLRHPIVELQDTVTFIPNDVRLSPSSSLHLITGPNMGGKSTFLRSVGCAVLMAQCGSFVPADSAELSVVDSVLVRIGASDCQAEGRSTFMAEMVETSAILASATSNSLILIDELGRGTSTYDGFGLAWAVSEHIAATLRSFCLFTTHYTELTQLAEKVVLVVPCTTLLNGSV